MKTRQMLGFSVVSFIAIAWSGFARTGEEWVPVFNGSDLKGWRGFKKDSPPPGWSVQDGVLYTSGKGGDLITGEQFENFELIVEWKTEKNGNSGILILADESPQRIWHHAPEVQIFDAKEGDTSYGHHAGALYALFPAKPESIKPAGEWNETRVKVDDGWITVIHNGVEVASVLVGSEEWNARVGKSKFAKFERFGRNKKGHIGLQGHGHQTWFRTVKLKRL